VIVRLRGVGAGVAAFALGEGRYKAVPVLLFHLVGGVALVVGGDQGVVYAVGGAVAAEPVQRAYAAAGGVVEAQQYHLRVHAGIYVGAGIGVVVLLIRVQGTVRHRAGNIAGGDGDGAGLQVLVGSLDGVGDAPHHDLIVHVVKAGHSVYQIVKAVPGGV